jgi:peptidoglycan/xylan/chitin deacetylase (PgdA/CDA1 family)
MTSSNGMDAAVAPQTGPLANRSRAAAFLMYHSISDTGPEYLHVPPETFARQLDTLARLGYATGGHEELDALAEGRRPPRPCAFLTFDDGFRDNYENALPVLRERGARAIVFLIPPLVDSGGDFRWPEVDHDRAAHPDVMRSMTWAMVEEMHEAGVEFGSHTTTHPDLTTCGDEELAQELLDSRRRIQERLGRCDSLAYPFNAWDERVARAAASAGYRYAFAGRRGAAGQPESMSHLRRPPTRMSIPRVSIDDRDTPVRFAAKLSGTGRRLLQSPVTVRLRHLLPAAVATPVTRL